MPVKNQQYDSTNYSIKDALCRIDIPLIDCKVQCYDGPSSIVRAKIEVATHDEIESSANLTHCHVHAVLLVVGDIIKTKIMRDTLDAAFELNKFIKYSISNTP